jgi:hypothetical protein
MSRNTVKKALASDSPPRYQGAPKGSIVDGIEPQIRALLAEFPDMPAKPTTNQDPATRGGQISSGTTWSRFERSLTEVRARRALRIPGMSSGTPRVRRIRLAAGEL